MSIVTYEGRVEQGQIRWLSAANQAFLEFDAANPKMTTAEDLDILPD